MIKSVVRVILIIIFSALLNGEYLVHGPGFFDIGPLIRFYIFFAIIIDSLVALYKLNDRSMFLFGGTAGLFIESFFNRSLYGDPFFAGVNLLSDVVFFLAWGLFATVLPLWLANRIIPRENIKKRKIRYAVLIFGILGMLSVLGNWA